MVNLDHGGQSFSPRILNGGRGEQAEATGLLYIADKPWPAPDDPALLDLVPDDWVITSGAGAVLDKARRPRLPQPYRVDVFGTITDDGLPVAFFERLDFCPSCKTSYESAQQSEFSRVASLGTEGRASAVTVLSEAVVRSLRAETDLDADARKFLAFSDNRQDASLQAGHFNDFVLVALVRSALYRAARDQHRRRPRRAARRREPGTARGRRPRRRPQNLRPRRGHRPRAGAAQTNRQGAARCRHLPAVGRPQTRLAHHHAQPGTDRPTAAVLRRDR